MYTMLVPKTEPLYLPAGGPRPSVRVRRAACYSPQRSLTSSTGIVTRSGDRHAPPGSVAPRAPMSHCIAWLMLCLVGLRAVSVWSSVSVTIALW